ncbi:MAG: response regulator transcription factor [Spirochaetales bacterium]|nr:response regulator transcription factor [Spirochaetales bacterium]
MPIRVFTIPFDPERERFPDRDLNEFLRDKTINSRKEDFFSRDGRDYWTVFIDYGPAPESAGAGGGSGPTDAGADERIRLQTAFGITVREAEVIRELSTGRTNREIGTRLNISERTVKAHVAKVYAKMNVDNKVALVNKLNDYRLFG